MITIVFEPHGTTFDNEQKLPSGHFDISLSPLGEQQSREMGKRYKGQHFDAIICSDLQRSWRSAELAFGQSRWIRMDSRLRECDYGQFTRKPELWREDEKIHRIHTPFPDGESYTQTTERMKSFLADLRRVKDTQRVMIIGHRATQYGLEHLINGVPLEVIIPAPWKWQPGWTYELK